MMLWPDQKPENWTIDGVSKFFTAGELVVDTCLSTLDNEIAFSQLSRRHHFAKYEKDSMCFEVSFWLLLAVFAR